MTKDNIAPNKNPNVNIPQYKSTFSFSGQLCGQIAGRFCKIERLKVNRTVAILRLNVKYGKGDQKGQRRSGL